MKVRCGGAPLRIVLTTAHSSVYRTSSSNSHCSNDDPVFLLWTAPSVAELPKHCAIQKWSQCAG